MRGVSSESSIPDDASPAGKKVMFMSRYALAVEMLRSMIDHKKVLVLALNGPGVGGGAAWFPGVGKFASPFLFSSRCFRFIVTYLYTHGDRLHVAII